MLTVSLVNYDTVCLLLCYLHPGTREISNAMKRQCLSCKQCHPSSRSSFDTRRGGTNWLLPIYLVEGKYELATSCEFLVTSREYEAKVEQRINFISSRELIIQLSYIRRDSYSISRSIF